jgi:DNA-binding XRE family transcriptional regulator
MDKADRDRQIADLYSSGETASALARSFSLSEATIRLIIREQGVKAGSRLRTEKFLRPSLGRPHERLGEQLVLCRSIEMRHTRQEASARLGWTVHKVAAVEGGRYDVTLTDLMDICTYTHKTLSELFPHDCCCG